MENGLPRTYEDPAGVFNVTERSIDFQETIIFAELKEILVSKKLVTIQGSRGSGKQELLKGLLHDRYEEEKLNRALVWSFPRKERNNQNFTTSLNACFEKASQKFNLTFSNVYSDMEEKFLALIKELQENNIPCLFGFTEIGSDFCNVLRKIMTSNCCQAVVAVAHDKHIFSQAEKDALPDYVEKVIVVGFETDEAVNYLNKKPGSSEGANEVAKYFGNYPLCLKVALEYCSRNNIQNYCTFLEQLKKSCSFFYEEGLKILANNQHNKASFETMHPTMYNKGQMQHVATIPMHALKGLSLLCNDDIPLFIIGKFCQNFVKKQPSGNTIEFEQNTSETWLVQANKFVQAIKLGFPLLRSDTDCVSIPKYFMQFVKNQLEGNNSVDLYLDRCIFVSCQMLSKDNRHSARDLKLKQARKHFEALLNNAYNFLFINYKLKKQSESDFLICMGRLKLKGLVGQALVQTRDVSTRKDALAILRSTVDELWEICQSGQSFLSCFQSKHDSSIFDWEEKKDPKETAKIVVKKCLAASEKIDVKFIAKLMEISLVVNKDKFDDFVIKYALTNGMSDDRAKDKLAPIWKVVEKESVFGAKEIPLLRETENLLSDDKYRKCFFAEFFCSVLHIIGRQDLYIWQARMNIEEVKEIKQCQYSSELSHFIATELRKKTDICLLYEYITIANCKVPRMLQNRTENEDDHDRQQRLKYVISTCTDLQQDKTIYFEDGLYMATYYSIYSKLNRAKYFVKAANKMLKTNRIQQNAENQPTPHDGAVEWCKNLFDLAKEQIGLDMGPTCVITAAKYFASVKLYPEAFEAFKFAFEAKKSDDDEPYFSKYLTRRPKTFAWGLINCARAFINEGSGLNEPWKKNVKEMLQNAYDSDHPEMAGLKLELNGYIGKL